MKNFFGLATNYIAFALATVVLSAAQTSLWLHLFGWFPAPQFWLTVLVFWVLYRHIWESVLMIYIISVVAAPFTSLPFAQILTINLMTGIGLLLAKRRVYWSGATFYMLATGGAVMLFWVSHLFISWRYDVNPVREFAFFSLLITLLLTMFVSLPLHAIYSWIDHLSNKEHPTEAGTGVM